MLLRMLYNITLLFYNNILFYYKFSIIINNFMNHEN